MPNTKPGMSDEFHYEDFDDQRVKLLFPVVEPEEERLRSFLRSIVHIFFVLAIGYLAIGILVFLSTGRYVFPWWLLLVMMGIIATPLLVDRDPDLLPLVDELRDNEKEIYNDLAREVRMKLGEGE